MTCALTRLLITLLMIAALPSAAAVGQPLARTAAARAVARVPSGSQRVEQVTFRDKGEQRTLTGRVVIEAASGGLLLETDDGALWIIRGEDVLSRRSTARPFVPLTHEKMAEKLLAEMPAGFRIHTTPHYVVCYNTSRVYAQWTSSLLERLHRAFTAYWERQGLKLRSPEFPLAVMVFADRREYDQASRDDLPGGTAGVVGYYSLRSNRITMYDLTGAEALAGSGRRGSLKEINEMLSQPEAVPLVATIVHEATHQITFNCGLQQRYADIPLWLAEGMAVYFEAPDLASTRGWRGIGKVNYARLDTFRRNASNWRDGTLEKVLADDALFRDPQTAVDAYAAAWALNYYLIKYHPTEYADYLEVLSKKRPLVRDDRAARLDDFRRHFGELGELQRDFLKQIARIK